MSGEKVITLDMIRAEKCDEEVNAVLDKYQCHLVFEQRILNGVCVASRIYSVPKKPKEVPA